MRATSITIVLVASLALAGAAAATPGCPDCHASDPPPIKHDCGYESVHQGAAKDNASEATNDGVCVSNAHHKQGPWVKLDLCFESFVNKIAHKLGIHVELQVYASQDGADVNSEDNVAGHAVSYDKTPVVGRVDDATWRAASKVHAQADPVLEQAHVDTRDAPVGGDQLPHAYVDACSQAQLGLC